ncbi:hypothetical protein AB9M62_28990 [Bacillales bacterium AN1005]
MSSHMFYGKGMISNSIFGPIRSSITLITRLLSASAVNDDIHIITEKPVYCKRYQSRLWLVVQIETFEETIKLGSCDAA